MIYNKSNDAFEYEGKTYKVGDKIIANKESEYAGLLGKIIEIRTDEDRETENDTPDVYCAFEPPVIPIFVTKLEERFTGLYGETKTVNDIALDSVVMAPSMLMFASELTAKKDSSATIYCVTEDWAYHGECDIIVSLFSDLSLAQTYMCIRVAEEIAENSVPFNQRGEEGIEESSSDMYYDIYEDGDYNENHFSILIEPKIIYGNET